MASVEFAILWMIPDTQVQVANTQLELFFNALVLTLTQTLKDIAENHIRHGAEQASLVEFVLDRRGQIIIRRRTSLLVEFAAKDSTVSVGALSSCKHI